jgi:hypothetical protein
MAKTVQVGTDDPQAWHASLHRRVSLRRNASAVVPCCRLNNVSKKLDNVCASIRSVDLRAVPAFYPSLWHHAGTSAWDIMVRHTLPDTGNGSLQQFQGEHFLYPRIKFQLAVTTSGRQVDDGNSAA